MAGEVIVFVSVILFGAEDVSLHAQDDARTAGV